ncbi:hypothetical protein AB0E10_41230 [Streptomyces sp. NPDC048045]|uniref:hypothetical protein n=1 Tax=Streptomyces sp. NPDC048045 TaxID=3154710 RepID=UPI003447CFE9
MGTTLVSGTTTYSAWLARSHVQPSTSAPVSATTPAKSLPWPEGNVAAKRSAGAPERIAASPGLIPAALTLTRTWLGPAAGPATSAR